MPTAAEQELNKTLLLSPEKDIEFIVSKVPGADEPYVENPDAAKKKIAADIRNVESKIDIGEEKHPLVQSDSAPIYISGDVREMISKDMASDDITILPAEDRSAADDMFVQKQKESAQEAL